MAAARVALSNWNLGPAPRGHRNPSCGCSPCPASRWLRISLRPQSLWGRRLVSAQETPQVTTTADFSSLAFDFPVGRHPEEILAARVFSTNCRLIGQQPTGASSGSVLGATTRFL